ncbi:hypothetical protein G7046_g141 [Stylonectria norvegica]|nr:hypothetical protein G7046_g141 [Stylonectria norvegica]
MVNTRSSSSRAGSVVPESLSEKPATAGRRSAAATPANSTWRHTPTSITLFWLFISVPLVAWDTGYVLGRPLTMEGGSLHWPLWSPYKLYGTIDHVYGWKAFNAGSGFTSAQGFLNLIESLMYLAYLWLFWSRSQVIGADESARKSLVGRNGALAVLVGFSAAVMTLSKTVLYWANEYYSGFDNIGHNTAIDLIYLWIIPNGAWLVFPTYMIWSLGNNIIDGLVLASEHVKEE